MERPQKGRHEPRINKEPQADTVRKILPSASQAPFQAIGPQKNTDYVKRNSSANGGVGSTEQLAHESSASRRKASSSFAGTEAAEAQQAQPKRSRTSRSSMSATTSRGSQLAKSKNGSTAPSCTDGPFHRCLRHGEYIPGCRVRNLLYERFQRYAPQKFITRPVGSHKPSSAEVGPALGFIYAYQDEKHSDFVKIGFSEVSVGERVGAQELECKQSSGTLLVVATSKEIIHPRFVEALIFRELRSHRYRRSCRCGKEHGEWFKITIERAKGVLKRWSEFIQSEPEPFELDVRGNRHWWIYNKDAEENLDEVLKQVQIEIDDENEAIQGAHKLERRQLESGKNSAKDSAVKTVPDKQAKFGQTEVEGSSAERSEDDENSESSLDEEGTRSKKARSRRTRNRDSSRSKSRSSSIPVIDLTGLESPSPAFREDRGFMKQERERRRVPSGDRISSPECSVLSPRSMPIWISSDTEGDSEDSSKHSSKETPPTEPPSPVTLPLRASPPSKLRRRVAESRTSCERLEEAQDVKYPELKPDAEVTSKPPIDACPEASKSGEKICVTASAAAALPLLDPIQQKSQVHWLGFRFFFSIVGIYRFLPFLWSKFAWTTNTRLTPARRAAA